MFATNLYPRAVLLRRSEFLHSFRFLFMQFKPDRYFAGIFTLFCGLLLSVVPIAFVGNVTLQVLSMSSLITVSLVFQSSAAEQQR